MGWLLEHSKITLEFRCYLLVCMASQHGASKHPISKYSLCEWRLFFAQGLVTGPALAEKAVTHSGSVETLDLCGFCIV